IVAHYVCICFFFQAEDGIRDKLVTGVQTCALPILLVELNCESDFVARTEAFQQLCHDIAMHIAALDPRYVRREEVTPDMLEKEREIYRAQALATGKPEAVVERIVTGKMEKFYEENCLYEQHYIKDEGVTIGEMVSNAVAKLGENITIRRFSRFK